VPGPQLLAKKLLERLADNEIGKLLEEAGLL
jgi:hypothetical protein